MHWCTEYSIRSDIRLKNSTRCCCCRHSLVATVKLTPLTVALTMHDEAPHAAQQQRYRFKFVVFDWHGTIEADPKASRDRVRHLFASDDEAVRFRTCYKQHKREHVRLVKESEGALEYDKMAVVRHTFDVYVEGIWMRLDIDRYRSTE